jgi:MOSC domain-containing protein YiiM
VPTPAAQVLSVNTGRPETGRWTGRVGRTGIRKTPVAGPAVVRRGGLGGDHVCDRKHHGGPDQAVYAFAREDLDAWGERLGSPLPDGHFGENLTTTGLDVNEALIGERWRVGTALLEVATVRIPCRVFAGFMGVTGHQEQGWIRRFTAEGRPGPYLRVLEEGVVEAGDPVVVEHRPDHGVTVAVVFRALTTQRSLLPGLVRAPELAADVRARAERSAGSPTGA